MASTFHPQCYRGTVASTQDSAPSHKVPALSSTPTLSTSATPSLPSLPYQIPRCSAPTYGLPTPDLKQYTLHPASTPTLPFYQISAKDYAEVVRMHDEIKLDSDILFPWLHGADVEGSAQAAHFHQEHGHAHCPLPRYRGMVTLNASQPRTRGVGPPSALPISQASTTLSQHLQPTMTTNTTTMTAPTSPAHSRNPTSESMATSSSSDSFSSAYTSSESNISSTSNSTTSLNSTVSSLNTSVDGQSRPSSLYGKPEHREHSALPTTLADFVGPADQPSMLFSTLRPTDVLQSPDINRFVPYTRHLLQGVNFRNFRLQTSKFVSVSDIYVYSESMEGGLASESAELAKRCKEAVMWCEKERRDRGEWWALRYNVFIIMDPFVAIEKDLPHLVQIDSAGFPKDSSCISLAEKEHVEMRKLTKATEIGENVYLGNTWDVPLSEDMQNQDGSSPLVSGGGASKHSSENPQNYAICIDTRDQCDMSDVAALYHRETYLNALETKYELEAAHAAQTCTVEQSWREETRTVCVYGERRHGSRSRSRVWFESSDEDGEGVIRGQTDDEDSSDAESEVTTTSAESLFGEVEEEEDEEDEVSDGEDFRSYSSDKENSALVGARRNVSLSMRRHRTTKSRRSSSVITAVGPKYSSSAIRSGPIKTQFKKSKSLKTAIAEKWSLTSSSASVSRSTLFHKSPSPATSSASSIKEEEQTGVLAVKTEDILHIEALSTCQVYNYHPNAKEIISDAIVEYCIWIRMQARPNLRSSRIARRYWGQASTYQERFSVRNMAEYDNSEASKDDERGIKGRRVLIHSMDGYTDSSVLSLAYLMYDKVLTLPKAYLYLQNDLYKSFFVYPADLPLLNMLEKKILDLVAKQGRLRVNDDTAKGSVMDFILQQLEREKEAPVAPPSPPSRLAASARSYLPRPSFLTRNSSATSTTSTVRALTPTSPSKSVNSKVPAAPVAGNVLAAPWFYNDKFDGHFPSRILDFMYLGNLNHASNALMLKELGITHVLSIGESALVPPSKFSNIGGGAKTMNGANMAGRVPTNSLWFEESVGNIKVLDIQNIQDDGVDPILPHLRNALVFMEQTRASGGKILVHCRAGVSRSATLVIAYLMRFMDLSLVDAYLMVRARRLNILIQPTLPFMYTLHQLEYELRTMPEQTDSSEVGYRSPKMSWPVLALEIANLNAKYLNC